MRLIDADALKASYVVTSTTTNSLCHLYVSLEDINSAPTIDAVSVVRCKECKHANSEPPIADGRSWCVLHGCFMYYCSDGEREGE